ncbi:MAG: tetratricopeptide repeat protein [Pseudomonadota bacterium]
MEEYLSERQQVEQVKSWVKENAAWAIGGLVLGFVLLFGIKQWKVYTESKAQAGAEQYQLVLQALSRNDTAGADKIVKTLQDDYRRTPYNDLANLAYVRFDVEAGRLEPAATRLQSVVQSTNDPEMAQVARMRLARVQAALGKFDDALKTLGDATGPAFDDVRGDVLFQKGDRSAAVVAWNAVLASGAHRGVDRQILELKIGAAGGIVTAVHPDGTP